MYSFLSSMLMSTAIQCRKRMLAPSNVLMMEQARRVWGSCCSSRKRVRSPKKVSKLLYAPHGLKTVVRVGMMSKALSNSSPSRIRSVSAKAAKWTRLANVDSRFPSSETPASSSTAPGRVSEVGEVAPLISFNCSCRASICRFNSAATADDESGGGGDEESSSD